MKKLQHHILTAVLLLSSIIPLFISNMFFFLKDPPVWPDEPVFYEMAHNLVNTGKATAAIYSGTSTGVEQTGLGYPPLYFHTLGLWTNLFGSQIESIRSLSLLLGILSLTVFFVTLLTVFKNRFLATIGTITLSLNISFTRAARLGRMEVMVFFFLIVSLLSFYIVKDKRKPYFYLIPGLFTAFAAMSHPIGGIAFIVIFLSILFNKYILKEKVLSLVFISIPLFTSIALWLLSFGRDFISLISTYGAHLSDKSPKIPYAWVLFNSDPSWKFMFLVYITIFIISLFLMIRKKQLTYIPFVIGAIISTTAFIVAKEGGYMVYLQLFIIPLLVFLFSVNTGKASRFKLITIILFLLTIISNLNIQLLNNDNIAINGFGKKSLSKARSYNYHEFTKIIKEVLEKEETGRQIFPIGIFIAATPDPYFDLKEDKRFMFYEAADPDFPISNTSYKKILDSSDYLIISWLPHKFLADYINKNTEKSIQINQSGGYRALLIKLKTREKRV